MKRVLIGVCLLLLIAAGAMAWRVWPRSRSFYTDADSIKQPIETVQPRDILWQPPVKLADILSAEGDDCEPQLSADGLTLLFVRGRPGHNADIYSSRRTPDGWSRPERLAAVDSDYDDLGPELGRSGGSLYFYSDRPGGAGGYDLWVVHRGPAGWQSPQNLGVAVNSEFDEYGPALAPDGQTLYFASNRPKPNPAPAEVENARPRTLPEAPARRDYDLYFAPIVDGALGQAAPLTALNTSADEGAPSVSPVDDFLYFCSDRPGGIGGFDIYRSRRLHGEHLAPESLGEPVNSTANELDPAVGLGGYGLHFSSNRPRADSAREDSADYDLYYTTSREVFSEAEQYRASIDWAALWSQIGANLLWALLALLLLLLLLAVMRDLKDGRLALLTKCLLASLMAHLLLMLLLNFWHVTVGLVDALSRRGPLQVALVSPARDSIEAQVRGRLTEAMDVETAAASLERAMESIETEPLDSVMTMTVDRTEVKPPTQSDVEQMISDAEQSAPEPPEVEPLRATVAAATPVELELPSEPRPARAVPEEALDVANATPPLTDSSREQPDLLTEPATNSAMAALEVGQHVAESPEPVDFKLEPSEARRPVEQTPAPTPMSIETAVAIDIHTPSEAAPIETDETNTSELAAHIEPVQADKTDARIPTTQPVERVAEIAVAPTARDVADESLAAADVSTLAARSEAAVADPVTQDLPTPVEDLPPVSIASIPGPTDSGSPARGKTEATPQVAFSEAAVARADTSTPPGREEVGSAMQRIEPEAVHKAATESSLAATSADVPRWAPARPATNEASGEFVSDSGVHRVAELALPAPSDAVPESESEPSIRVASAEPASSRYETDGRDVSSDAATNPVSLAALTPTRSGTSTADRRLFDPKSAAIDTLPTQWPGDRTSDQPGDVDAPQDIPLALELPSENPRSSRAEPSEQFAAAGIRPPPSERTRIDSVVTDTGQDQGAIYDVQPQRHAAEHLVAVPSAPDEAVADATPVGIDASQAAMQAVALAPLPGRPETPLTLPGDQDSQSESEPLLASSFSELNSAEPSQQSEAASVAEPTSITLLDTTAPRHRYQADTPESATNELPPPADSPLPSTAALLLAVSPERTEWKPVDLAVSLPKEMASPTTGYVQRSPEMRLPLVERMGGSRETERAVNLALGWLAAHQSRSGRWDANNFDAECGECGGETDIEADRALTGLALLCFLGADHSHVKKGPYRENVSRALEWLVHRQLRNGDLRGDETMYSHGIVTIAMSEAYGMTGDPALEEPVVKAIDFIVKGRNKRLGGWRYDPGQVGDTSVLGWQVMALKSARMAGIDVPEEAFESGRQWLSHVETEDRPGLYCYRPGRRYSDSMTAEGMFALQLLGAPRDDARMKGAVAFLSDRLPNWNKNPNTYYWYYATLALYQHQGPTWKRWNAALTSELLEHQRTDGRAAGSWDPSERWSQTGGRVYQTALCALMLEVYYRYLPLYNINESN